MDAILSGFGLLAALAAILAGLIGVAKGGLKSIGLQGRPASAALLAIGVIAFIVIPAPSPRRSASNTEPAASPEPQAPSECRGLLREVGKLTTAARSVEQPEDFVRVQEDMQEVAYYTEFAEHEDLATVTATVHEIASDYDRAAIALQAGNAQRVHDLMAGMQEKVERMNRQLESACKGFEW